MTIAVTIKNEEAPDAGRTLIVKTVAYEKGVRGSREVQHQRLQPGQSALFHVHMLKEVHIIEEAE